MINRRHVLGAIGGGSLAALAPIPVLAAATPRVIVVGGGMAGVAAAKYIRLWSGKTIAVTLITPDTGYVSNIMSNLVITGQLAYSKLQFAYTKLASNHGVTVVKGTVTDVSGYGSALTGTVKLSSGASYTSERLVLAPGISMDEVPVTRGVDGQTAPVLHAWQAGAQTTALQTLLAGMPANASARFVLTIPGKPYRCPPGPYERACVIADYLYRNKPGAKIYVLDENPDITAEPENFRKAFANYYQKGVLEYWPSTKVNSVTAPSGAPAVVGKQQTVSFTTTDVANTIGANSVRSGELYGDVMNIIPPHRAPEVARLAGVVPAGARFAPVSVLTFESMVAGRQKIHVIGDASDTSLPKAGHVANQEAKICANAIINLFKGLAVEPMPTANSACFSPINSTQASWLTAVYQYRLRDANGAELPENKRFVTWDGVSQTYASATEASAPSTGNFSKMTGWYNVLMGETFT